MPIAFDPLYGYAPDLALLLRVFLGASLVVHGYPKLKGGWKQAGQWMGSMGVPSWTAPAATALEFFGGIVLLLGLVTPAVAALVALQFGSIIGLKKSKMHASFASTEQGKPTYEIDAFYLALALALVVLGAGALSLDGFLGL
jgi:putative oxidoreductase